MSPPKPKQATGGAKRRQEVEKPTESSPTASLPRHLRREFRLSVEITKGIVLAYEANAMTKPWWMLEFGDDFAFSVDGATASALIAAANSERTPLKVSRRMMSNREIDERIVDEREGEKNG
jgi:hypothetical protein